VEGAEGGKGESSVSTITIYQANMGRRVYLLITLMNSSATGLFTIMESLK
jgi:hypothetical protein